MTSGGSTLEDNLVGSGDKTTRAEPAVTNSFDFDEAAFRDYCGLFLLPHDKVGGRKLWFYFSVIAVPAFIIGVYLICDLAGHFGVDTEYAKGVIWRYEPALAICACGCFVLFFSQSVLGFRMMLGLRMPRWGTPRWDARTRIAFARLKSGYVKSPSGMYQGIAKPLRDDWPLLFQRSLTTFVILPYILGATDEFDEPLLFDSIPGLFPRFKSIPDVDDLSIRFSSAFLPDRIEKGSHGAVFARSYADVHDVVEDERYPNLAIIRHENGYSQLVVRTDMLEGGTWDEVKARIAATKGV